MQAFAGDSNPRAGSRFRGQVFRCYGQKVSAVLDVDVDQRHEFINDGFVVNSTINDELVAVLRKYARSPVINWQVDVSGRDFLKFIFY